MERDGSMTRDVSERLQSIRYLTFSSSGRAGISYHGVLLALEALDRSAHEALLKNLKGVGGTSGGSLIALAVALGIPSERRLAIVNEFLSVLTQPTECPNLSLLFHAHGLDDGVAFRDKVGGMLAVGGLSPTATLGDLERLLRLRLVFVAHDLISGRSVYLSADTYPSMLVRDAAMASCCIPLLFTPVRHEGLLLVDGAMSEAYPVPFPTCETLSVVVDLPIEARDDVSSWTSFLRAIFTSTTAAQQRVAESRDPPASRVFVTDAFLLDVNDLSVPLAPALVQQTVLVGMVNCVATFVPRFAQEIGRQVLRLVTLRERGCARRDGDDDEDGRCTE